MKKSYFIFLAIFLIALAPRAVEIISTNFLFGHDQGLFFQAVKKIVVDYKPTLIGAEAGGHGGIFQGPGWYYLLAVPFFIWGGNPYGGMVLMFVIGMAVVIFSYYFALKMFGKSTAFFVGILAASSPALVSQSRIIWPPFPIALLSVFYVYFFWLMLQKKRIGVVGLLGVVGAMTHFEIATAGTLLLLTIIYLPFLIVKKYILLKDTVLAFCFLVVLQAPLILFDLRHDFIITKGIHGILMGRTEGHVVTFYYVKLMFQNHINVFIYNFQNTFLHSNYLIFPLLLLAGYSFLRVIKDKKTSRELKIFISFLITSPFLLFMILMMYLWPMWEWWIVQLSIFYIFLFGILLGYLSNTRNFLRLVVVVFVSVIVVAHVIQTVHFYKTDFKDFGGVHKIKGKIEAIDFVYKDAKSSEFGLFVFTPPVNTYAYDYLLWWYGQKKYNYVPPQEKKETFYLLIEPDPHKKWTYKGWMETVIKDGKVEYTKQLPSGFIIQKRYVEK